MDFKNLASKIIDDVSGIKSTETSKNVEENDILEGLDLDFSETEYKDLSEDFDLDIEDEIPEESSQKVEQLFDGYLGEKNFAPNPLEYGPNAMYRQNGTVYRKSVDNLWEAYLKDGSPGPRGSAGGSGTGVQEVQKIANDVANIVSSAVSTDISSILITSALNLNNLKNSFDLLNGSLIKNRVLLNGSSTTEACTTINLVVTQTSAEFNEYSNGYWFYIQKHFNNPFELALNIGVGGSVLSAQTNTLSNVISSTSANVFDIVFLQYMANDISTTINIPSYTSAILNDIRKCLAAGKKVILIVPHPKSDGTISDVDFALRAVKYQEYLSWCKLIESLYSGSVFCVDHYSIWNGERIPSQYSTDGVHLTFAGWDYVIPNTWSEIINKLGFSSPTVFDGYSFGGNVMKILYGSASNVTTQSVSGYYLSADEYGRSRFYGSAVSDTAHCQILVSALTSGIYKLFVDFEFISEFVGGIYTAGVVLQGGSPIMRRRIGFAGGAFPSNLVPGRHRMLSAPIYVPVTANHNLFFYTGGQSILYAAYLIKVS